MDVAEQNTAIAKICGFTYHGPEDMSHIALGCYRGPRESYPYFTALPDYTNDLNAMHEAEKILTTEQWGDYYSLIEWVMDISTTKSERYKKIKLIHATSAQKAEAFLRIHNLWK